MEISLEQISWNGEECPICLESLNDVLCLSTPCEHRFHTHCLLQWIDRNGDGKRCPLCEASLDERYTFYSYVPQNIPPSSSETAPENTGDIQKELEKRISDLEKRLKRAEIRAEGAEERAHKAEVRADIAEAIAREATESSARNKNDNEQDGGGGRRIGLEELAREVEREYKLNVLSDDLKRNFPESRLPRNPGDRDGVEWRARDRIADWVNRIELNNED